MSARIALIFLGLPALSMLCARLDAWLFHGWPILWTPLGIAMWLIVCRLLALVDRRPAKKMVDKS